MSSDRLIRIFAGSFILLSLALAHVYAQVDMGRLSWLWFTAFVGGNLLQSGFTRFCPLEIILCRLGAKKAG